MPVTALAKIFTYLDTDFFLEVYTVNLIAKPEEDEDDSDQDEFDFGKNFSKELTWLNKLTTASHMAVLDKLKAIESQSGVDTSVMEGFDQERFNRVAHELDIAIDALTKIIPEKKNFMEAKDVIERHDFANNN